MSTEVEAKFSADSEQNEPKSADEDEHVAPADSSDNGGMVTENDFAEDEVGPIIEAIASTGTFWTDWDKLKSMLSFKLKQVLSEYPEAKMTAEQQGASLGETYPELVKRLNEALLSFDEGPPFTLQRLCEILLSAQSIYPKLSKLALALEKNLLVTSMLKSGGKPWEELVEKESNDLDRVAEGHQLQSNLKENGVDTVMEDRDETMADLEEAEADGGVNAEDYGEIVEPSESCANQDRLSLVFGPQLPTSMEYTSALVPPSPLATQPDVGVEQRMDIEFLWGKRWDLSKARSAGEKFIPDWDLKVDEQSIFNPNIATRFIAGSMLPKDDAVLVDFCSQYSWQQQNAIAMSAQRDADLLTYTAMKSMGKELNKRTQEAESAKREHRKTMEQLRGELAIAWDDLRVERARVDALDEKNRALELKVSSIKESEQKSRAEVDKLKANKERLIAEIERFKKEAEEEKRLWDKSHKLLLESDKVKFGLEARISKLEEEKEAFNREVKTLGENINKLQAYKEALEIGDRITEKAEEKIWQKMFASSQYVDLQIQCRAQMAKEIRSKLMKEVPNFDPRLLIEECLWEEVEPEKVVEPSGTMMSDSWVVEGEEDFEDNEANSG